MNSTWLPSGNRKKHFACSHGTPATISLFFSVPSDEEPPHFEVVDAPSIYSLDCRFCRFPQGSGIWKVAVWLAPTKLDVPDDNPKFTVLAHVEGETFSCDVVLRRTSCRLNLHAIESNNIPVSPQTKAALLWHGWNQYEEIIGIKRFTSGLSGSDVLVFSPRLRDPATLPHASPRIPVGVLKRSRGASLLVKTDRASVLTEEYERCQMLLRDRMTPFIARTEVHITAQLASENGPPQLDEKGALKWQSTLISNFLGGDVLPTESLESLIRSTYDSVDGSGAIASLFEVLKPWHRDGQVRTLSEWRFVAQRPPSPPRPTFAGFDFGSDHDYVINTANLEITHKNQLINLKDQAIHLYTSDERHDHNSEKNQIKGSNEDSQTKGFFFEGNKWFADKSVWDTIEGISYKGRRRYSAGLEWETDFKSSDHLSKFVLGTGRHKGLLEHLKSVPLRFSLTHGDMHPRNALIERGHAWIIDFGHLGVGPTLFDFAQLELCVRLWCLELSSGGGAFDEGAYEFEQHLLDHLLGHEASWQKVRDIASQVDAPASYLLKIAHTIVAIRRNARSYMIEEAEDRDYLAVLYLAVLRLLGLDSGRKTLLQRRWLVSLAWALEERLCHSFGLQPFARYQTKFLPHAFVNASWISAPRAPERISYLLDREDGKAALPEVEALRGMMQGGRHHLDVFDHTLLVLAYLEELLHDPLRGLLESQTLDERVAQSLRAQGFSFPQPHSPHVPVNGDYTINEHLTDNIGTMLKRVLSPEARRLLKWVALLHDCGKPMSRTVVKPMSRLVRRLDDSLQVRFIGHAAFSAQLVRPLFQHLYGDSESAEKTVSNACYLIEKHHLHHELFDIYGTDEGLVQLAEVFVTNDLSPVKQLKRALDNLPMEFPDCFPLLMLHGFADCLACRGSIDPYSPIRLAVFNRLVLGIYARRQQFDEVQEQRQSSRAGNAQLFDGWEKEAQAQTGQTLSSKATGQLRLWFNKAMKEDLCPNYEEFLRQRDDLNTR